MRWICCIRLSFDGNKNKKKVRVIGAGERIEFSIVCIGSSVGMDANGSYNDDSWLTILEGKR